MSTPEITHIISLGAGVQSSTMALMAAAGAVKRKHVENYYGDDRGAWEITLGNEPIIPKAAVFADTQAEPKSVYAWLDWLEKQLPFPVYRVTAGNLAHDSIQLRRSKLSGKIYMKGAIPAFVKKPFGPRGFLGRQCTADYKVRPLTAHVRSLCDWKRGEQRKLIKLWIGISRDEVIRMKPSREEWIEHIWPLVELGMTRGACLEWMKKNGFPEPPRSACIFCPFHSDAEWIRLRDEEPDEFKKCVLYERALQEGATKQEVLTGIPFLHSSCVPLDQVVFGNLPEKMQLSLFGNECEGMCGV